MDSSLKMATARVKVPFLGNDVRANRLQLLVFDLMCGPYNATSLILILVETYPDEYHNHNENHCRRILRDFYMDTEDNFVASLQMYAVSHNTDPEIFKRVEATHDRDALPPVIEQFTSCTANPLLVVPYFFKGTDDHWGAVLAGITPSVDAEGLFKLLGPLPEDGISYLSKVEESKMTEDQWRSFFTAYPEPFGDINFIKCLLSLDNIKPLVQDNTVRDGMFEIARSRDVTILDRYEDLILPIINDQDEDGNTIFHYAVGAYRESSDPCFKRRKNILMFMNEESETELYSWYIDRGADPTIENNEGKTVVKHVMGSKYASYLLFSGKGSTKKKPIE